MKTATYKDNDKRNVQSSNEVKKDALMVVQAVEQPNEVAPAQEKHDQKEPEKIEELKATIESFAPSAEDRIQRAKDFEILTGKFTHLKMKKQELDRFMLSSDGSKEKIVLENSAGVKIEVNNSSVLKKVQKLMNDTLDELLKDAEQQVRTFVI